MDSTETDPHEELEKHLAHLQNTLQLIRECHTHRSNAVTRAMPMDNVELQRKVASGWHTYFNELNAEGMMRVSRTDMAFIALCLAQACSKPSLTQGVNLGSITQVYGDMIVLSCQHTQESRQYWPSAEEWVNLRDRISGVVVTFFDTGISARQTLIEQLNADKTVVSTNPLLPHLHIPPLLAAEKEKRARKLALDKENGVKVDSREEVSEEAMGLLWRSSPEELAFNFVRVASRLVHCVEQDLHFAIQTQMPECVLPSSIHEHVRTWVKQRCSVEQIEELTMLFRNIANEWFWPVGASTHRWRNTHTRTDLLDSLTVLNDEVGVELGQHLHDRSLARPSAIAADTKGLFWDALFMALFSYMMLQRLKLNWRELYFFQDAHSSALAQRLASDHFMGDEKRPVIVYLQRKYWIVYKEALAPCSDLAHSILSWLYIVRQDFGGKLENTEDVNTIIAIFLSPSN